MDKVTSAIVAENISKQASFSVSFSLRTPASALCRWSGTAPPEQKKKYLPKIASGENHLRLRAPPNQPVAPTAVNAKTKAVLSPDGKTYTLNGEKMWISNAGFADLFQPSSRSARFPTVPTQEKKNSQPS